jgi:hypothetical protein
MKTSFVKEQISIYFCLILLLLRSAVYSVNCLPTSSCYPFHFNRTAAFQCQENHQNQDLFAIISVTIEDDQWVKNWHLSMVTCASIGTTVTILHKDLCLT